MNVCVGSSLFYSVACLLDGQRLPQDGDDNVDVGFIFRFSASERRSVSWKSQCRLLSFRIPDFLSIVSDFVRFHKVALSVAIRTLSVRFFQ